MVVTMDTNCNEPPLDNVRGCLMLGSLIGRRMLLILLLAMSIGISGPQPWSTPLPLVTEYPYTSYFTNSPVTVTFYCVKMKGFCKSNLPVCVVAACVVWVCATHDATSAIAPPGLCDPCAHEGYVGSWTCQEVAPPCPVCCLQVRCVLVVPFFPHSCMHAACRAFVLCYNLTIAASPSVISWPISLGGRRLYSQERGRTLNWSPCRHSLPPCKQDL